jgi:hypothetical protein
MEQFQLLIGFQFTFFFRLLSFILSFIKWFTNQVQVAPLDFLNGTLYPDALSL